MTATCFDNNRSSSGKLPVIDGTGHNARDRLCPNIKRPFPPGTTPKTEPQKQGNNRQSLKSQHIDNFSL